MKRFLIIIANALAMVAVVAVAWALDRDTKSAGFSSVLERYSAAHAGYTDPQAYRAFRASEERRKADIARRAREEAAKSASQL